MPPKTFGQRVRQLREARDLSLREFAGKLGISAAHVSDIELGRRFPSEELMERITKTLRADVEELKKLDPRPPVDDLRRLSETNPAFGLALRRIVDKEVSPEDLLKLADEKPDREK